MPPGAEGTVGGAAAREALRWVCVSLPHLAGLAHAVRVVEDARVGTLGVFASGRMLVNPGWFAGLDRQEAVFAVAHELLHLALRTHDRAAGTDQVLFNLAHDCIINDILVEALGGPPPGGGLWLPGARHRSAEAIAAELRSDLERCPGLSDGWRGILRPRAPRAPDTALAAALRAAGLVSAEAEPPEEAAGAPAGPADEHVLPDALEATWFPDDAPGRRVQARQAVRGMAARAVSLDLLRTRLGRILADETPWPGEASGADRVRVEALQTLYRPPWELALQRWVEGAAPGPRSYARPSRRGADRADLVLAGRRREGWTLNVLLDTSGSMEGGLARTLGVIAACGESAGVAEVRLLQCDAAVTRDERLDVGALRTLDVVGLGASDLSPALNRLAEDPFAEAALVLTDGDIVHPGVPPPYAVLWLLTEPNPSFQPSYGLVLTMPPDDEAPPAETGQSG